MIQAGPLAREDRMEERPVRVAPVFRSGLREIEPDVFRVDRHLRQAGDQFLPGRAFVRIAIQNVRRGDRLLESRREGRDVVTRIASPAVEVGALVFAPDGGLDAATAVGPAPRYFQDAPVKARHVAQHGIGLFLQECAITGVREGPPEEAGDPGAWREGGGEGQVVRLGQFMAVDGAGVRIPDTRAAEIGRRVPLALRPHAGIQRDAGLEQLQVIRAEQPLVNGLDVDVAVEVRAPGGNILAAPHALQAGRHLARPQRGPRQVKRNRPGLFDGGLRDRHPRPSPKCGPLLLMVRPDARVAFSRGRPNAFRSQVQGVRRIPRGRRRHVPDNFGFDPCAFADHGPSRRGCFHRRPVLEEGDGIAVLPGQLLLKPAERALRVRGRRGQQLMLLAPEPPGEGAERAGHAADAEDQHLVDRRAEGVQAEIGRHRPHIVKPLGLEGCRPDALVQLQLLAHAFDGRGLGQMKAQPSAADQGAGPVLVPPAGVSGLQTVIGVAVLTPVDSQDIVKAFPREITPLRGAEPEVVLAQDERQVFRPAADQGAEIPVSERRSVSPVRHITLFSGPARIESSQPCRGVFHDRGIGVWHDFPVAPGPGGKRLVHDRLP